MSLEVFAIASYYLEYFFFLVENITSKNKAVAKKWLLSLGKWRTIKLSNGLHNAEAEQVEAFFMFWSSQITKHSFSYIWESYLIFLLN